MKQSLSKYMIMLWGMLFFCSAMADGTLSPQHGGRMTEADGNRLELVVSDNKIDLYLTDHGNRPVTVTGALAKAVLIIAGKKTEVVLQPTSGNLLTGTANLAGGSKAAAVITIEGLSKRITARMPAQH